MNPPLPTNEPSQPPMNEIAMRLHGLEPFLRDSLERLKHANDRLLGKTPEEKGATQLAPRGGAIINSILNSLDRLAALGNALDAETVRTDNLSSRGDNAARSASGGSLSGYQSQS